MRGRLERTQNAENWTPFHHGEASDWGKPDVVHLIFAYGACVNVLDEKKDTTLDKALQSGIFDIMELLVKCGAYINSQNKV